MALEMQREIIDFLKDWGAKNIHLVPGGKHPRLYFHWKGEEKFTVFPGSSGDIRAIDNQLADLRRELVEPIPKPVLRKRTLNEMVPSALEGAAIPRHFVPFVNAPGEFKMIPTKELNIDPDYQRPIGSAAVERIARNWSWPSAGVLLVSERENGRYFIFEGQHRWEAAKLTTISEWGQTIDALPCLVFKRMSRSDEAKSFLGANTERRVMYMSHQFNALRLTGDPVAAKAQELVDIAKRTVHTTSGAKTVTCISRLMSCIRKDEEALRRIWHVVCALNEGRSFHERILKGVFELERRMPEGRSLGESKHVARLLIVGPESILTEIRNVAAIEGNTSERVCAMATLRAYNKGHKGSIRIDLSK